jgi:hypothetical protein
MPISSVGISQEIVGSYFEGAIRFERCVISITIAATVAINGGINNGTKIRPASPQLPLGQLRFETIKAPSHIRAVIIWSNNKLREDFFTNLLGSQNCLNAIRNRGYFSRLHLKHPVITAKIQTTLTQQVQETGESNCLP